MTFQTKRVYDDADPGDGYRVLLDRIWPRGVSRERAAVDRWLKDVAPSHELRTWFDHRADRFAEFSDRYAAELDGNPAVDELREAARTHPTVTLLYGARSPELNQAVVLAAYLSRDPDAGES
ncbi:MAG: DUF488 family protein [Streptosporangiales bacterium]|nr:DUF488 family protein [Streptosporangiales bacterium]